MEKRDNQIILDIRHDAAEVKVVLTPVCEKVFKEDLDLEIEMLQGTVEKLPNDLTRFTFSVTDPDKLDTLRKFATVVALDCPHPNLN